jgi:hypothetical protein
MGMHACMVIFVFMFHVHVPLQPPRVRQSTPIGVSVLENEGGGHEGFDWSLCEVVSGLLMIEGVLVLRLNRVKQGG